VADAELRQGAPDLGLHPLRHRRPGLGSVEIMAAAIGVELAEQPVPVDHLRQRAKARGRALLRDDKPPIERAGRVVEGDHQIVLLLITRQPGKARGVLVQHHAHQRPPRPLLAMRRAPRRRSHQPRPLQRQPGHRVAELVVVPLLQLLVKMLHREALVAFVIEPQHAQDLLGRRSSARRLADPAIAQTLPPLLPQPLRPPLPHPAAPTSDRPLRHPQYLRRLLLRQLAPLMPIEQPLETHLSYPLQHSCPAHPRPPFWAVLKPDRSRATKTGQITRQPHTPRACLTPNAPCKTLTLHYRI